MVKPAVPSRISALTVPAFPSTYADPFSTDSKLDKALERAIDAGPGKSWHSAIAIVAINPDGKRPLATFRPDEVHFSASFIKVAAMYAAYELRATAKKIAAELGDTTKPALFADLAAYLDPKIMAKAATIKALNGLKKENGVPNYRYIFEPSPATGRPGFDIKFSKAYGINLTEMIRVSSNSDAAASIHGVGYGYLNGALTAGGFFEPSNNNGIWLAGDYTGTWPYFRIDSDNDNDVAQATTVRKMARLYTHLVDKTLVDGISSAGMLTLLKKAADVPEVWITRTPGLSFTVNHNKLGFAALKPKNSGRDIFSEGSVLTHTATGRTFVAIWQNFLLADAEPVFEVVSNVVDKTVVDYLH